MATASPQFIQTNKRPELQIHPAAPKKLECEFLTETGYAEWDELVDRSPHGTPFHYSWWLNVVANSFRLLVVRDEAGRMIGGIPLPEKRALGLELLHSPVLTPYLGPIFLLDPSDGICDQLHLMRSYGEALARSIGKFDSFRYIASANAPDLQGFLWAGFAVSLAYTFRFSALQSLEEITKGITRTHKQKLTKADRLGLYVSRDEGLETLLKLNKMTFERQGSQPNFSDSTLLQLWKAALSRGKGNLYLAYTVEGTPVAGLLTVHSQRTTYQIVSGFNPAFPNVPGQNFVLWTAVQDALKAGRDFDFEGSGMRGVEAFYRRWGAQALPVWRIEKAGSLKGAVIQASIRFKDSRRLQDSPRAQSSSV